MTDFRVPGPIGTGSLLDDVDDLEDGTLVRARSPLPGPMGIGVSCLRPGIAKVPPQREPAVSLALQDTVQVTASTVHPMRWDAFWRLAFERADRVLRSHARQLLQQHDMTAVEHQTLGNAWARVRQESRSPSSKLGQAYSRILKHDARASVSSGLSGTENKVDAVVESVGQSGTFQHRLAMSFRRAGSAFIVLEIKISTVAVPRDEREDWKPMDLQADPVRSPGRADASGSGRVTKSGAPAPRGGGSSAESDSATPARSGTKPGSGPEDKVYRTSPFADGSTGTAGGDWAGVRAQRVGMFTSATSATDKAREEREKNDPNIVAAKLNPKTAAQRATAEDVYNRAIKAGKSMDIALTEGRQAIQAVRVKEYMADVRASLPELMKTDPKRAQRLQSIADEADRALLANDVYFDETVPGFMPEGTRRLSELEVKERFGLNASDLNGSKAQIESRRTGYFAAIYETTESQGTGPYIYVNRGTDSRGDFVDGNIPQFIWGGGAQYAQAIKNAQRIIKSDISIEFAGHSLGGGLSIAQEAVTHHRVTAFNPASIQREQFIVDPEKSNTYHEKDSMIIVKGEVLDVLQEFTGGGSLDYSKLKPPSDTRHATVEFRPVQNPAAAIKPRPVSKPYFRRDLSPAEYSETKGSWAEVTSTDQLGRVERHGMTSVLDALAYEAQTVRSAR